MTTPHAGWLEILRREELRVCIFRGDVNKCGHCWLNDGECTNTWIRLLNHNHCCQNVQFALVLVVFRLTFFWTWLLYYKLDYLTIRSVIVLYYIILYYCYMSIRLLSMNHSFHPSFLKQRVSDGFWHWVHQTRVVHLIFVRHLAVSKDMGPSKWRFASGKMMIIHD